MLIVVDSTNYTFEINLKLKDFENVNEMLLEATTRSIEFYFDKNTEEIALPYFTRVKCRKKTYYVNNVVTLANAGKHMHSTTLREDIIENKCKAILDDIVIFVPKGEDDL